MKDTIWGHRIAELALLKEGWLGNGEGKKIDSEVINTVTAFLQELHDERRAMPAISPMASEPGMSLSWRFPTMNITLRVFAVDEIELSRFNPSEPPAIRRMTRERISLSNLEDAMNTWKRWRLEN